MGGRSCTLARGGQVCAVGLGGPLRCGPPAHCCVSSNVRISRKCGAARPRAVEVCEAFIPLSRKRKCTYTFAISLPRFLNTLFLDLLGNLRRASPAMRAARARLVPSGLPWLGLDHAMASHRIQPCPPYPGWAGWEHWNQIMATPVWPFSSQACIARLRFLCAR